MRQVPIRAKPPALLCCVIWAALASAACGRRIEVGEQAAVLHLALARAPGIELVLEQSSLEQSSLREAAQRTAQRLESTLGKPVELRTSAADVHLDWPRIVIGNGQGAESGRLAELLGIEMKPAPNAPWTYGTHTFRQSDFLLVATCEDPDRAGLPVTLVLSARPLDLVPWLARLQPAWRPSLRIFARGSIVLDTPLGRRGEARPRALRLIQPPWGADPRAYRGLELEDWPAGGRAANDVDALRMGPYLEGARTAVERAADFADPPSQTGASTAPLILHASIESFAAGALLGVAHELGRGASGLVEVLLAPDLPDDGGLAVCEIWLRTNLGEPVLPWLAHAVALDIVDSWWGQPLEEWGAALLLVEPALPLEELLDPASDARHSPHLLAPLRALYVRALRSGAGDELVRQYWSAGTHPAGAEHFDALCERIEGLHGAALRSARAERRAAATSGAFLRGLTLRFPAAALPAGPGTRPARQALAQISAAGANAVRFEIDFNAQGRPPGASALAAPARLVCLQGDVAMGVSLSAARAQGLRTCLSINVLASQSGTLAADLKLDHPQAIEAFVRSYGSCAIHAALLAELLGVDLLWIGSGLQSLPRAAGAAADPKDADEIADRAILDARRAGWLRLTRSTHSAFGGALSILARWPGQARELSFAAELDQVCVALPRRALDPSSNPRRLEEMLRKSLGEIEGLAAQRGQSALVLLEDPRRPEQDQGRGSTWPGALLGVLSEFEARGPEVRLRGGFLGTWHPAPAQPEWLKTLSKR